jgi:uncharacterized damage-inducible protein DinB
MEKRELTDAVRDKVLEALERTDHLVRLAPVDKLEWQPATDVVASRPTTDLGHLLGHLLDCAAGFCAALHAAYPSQLNDFASLRELSVNHACRPEDAARRLKQYSQCIARGFELCMDEDLGRKLPTVFEPQGERLATLLLGNLEHLLNHKYQLFLYLKLLGVPVRSSDLYRFRGEH